ncbi:conserved hypothetical protein [Cupriavidus taiwanensis]|uniref:Preprotein translocase subunit SecA n=1 Tax=Cupriavidus taiwanensis TaxID=164546 RepID=A0A375I9N2_9BURK|nr:conserved hypothetical protein [Cupriavidus taiwanensis]
MLSAHEFAALMILGNCEHDRQLDPADIEALVEHQLVCRERSKSGGWQARLTSEGKRFFDTIGRRR